MEFEKPTFDNFMELAFFLEDLFGEKVDLLTPKSLSPYMWPYVEKRSNLVRIKDIFTE